MNTTSKTWTPRETQITVDAYFDTLKATNSNKNINRQAVYNKLATRLSRRNPKAIEFRFHNIESILKTEDKPRLGLAPFTNTSILLRAAVLAKLAGAKVVRA
jgi:hypothetical protein